MFFIKIRLKILIAFNSSHFADLFFFSDKQKLVPNQPVVYHQTWKQLQYTEGGGRSGRVPSIREVKSFSVGQNINKSFA